MFRESFCAYCLAVPCRLNTPTDNFSHLPSIHSSPVDACMSQILEIPFDLPKILSILLLLKFLITCIMVNPISLEILLTSIVIIIWVRWFDLLRMLAILKQILEFLLPAQTSFLNMSWFLANQIAIDLTPKSSWLIHPWSELLLLIPWIENHNYYAI